MNKNSNDSKKTSIIPELLAGAVLVVAVVAAVWKLLDLVGLNLDPLQIIAGIFLALVAYRILQRDPQ